MRKIVCLATILFFSCTTVALADYFSAYMAKMAADSAAQDCFYKELNASNAYSSAATKRQSATQSKNSCDTKNIPNCTAHSNGHPDTCGGVGTCCKCDYNQGETYSSAAESQYYQPANTQYNLGVSYEQLGDGDYVTANGWMYPPPPIDYDAAQLYYNLAHSWWDLASTSYYGSTQKYGTAENYFSDAKQCYDDALARHP